MAIVTCDWETFYSQEYSLRKMSEIDYILDPRFQTIMCNIKVDANPGETFIGHKAVADRLASIDWSKSAFCAHNTRFDGAIAAWHFDVHPVLYLDTLGMARALTHAVTGRSSLEAVSRYLGLPDKGKEVTNALGLRLENMSPEFLARYADYCSRDNENCYDILQTFLKVMPRSELHLIDSVLRMFIEPQVYLDPHKLAEHLGFVRAESERIMHNVAGYDKSVFSSNLQFADLLTRKGVELPMKISPATGQEVPALAKNDRGFKELCLDDSQPLEVQALLAARLNAKSTLEETRTKTLLNLSQRDWGARGWGWAPVPIKYYGAHTGRVSGDGGFNWLNFKRGSPIRAAVCAPKGYRVVHRDASQIEARMVAWLAGCTALTSAFAEGRDVYSEFASMVYGRTITKVDVSERFVGKTSILGLGYQTGGKKLRHTLFIGNGGISVVVTEEESNKIVYTYRSKYHEIPDLWARGQDGIYRMMELAIPCRMGRRNRMRQGTELPPFPVVEFGADAVWLPNGMCIAYPNLRVQQGVGPSGKRINEIVYDDPYKVPTKLYGGKVTENISQGLTRIIVTDTIKRVKRSTDYNPFLHTYDSLDYCVPESEVEAFDKLLEAEFAVRPTWAPDLPLASEGGWGVTLLQAEKGMNV